MDDVLRAAMGGLRIENIEIHYMILALGLSLHMDESIILAMRRG
jgi:hypothetical protein